MVLLWSLFFALTLLFLVDVLSLTLVLVLPLVPVLVLVLVPVLVLVLVPVLVLVLTLLSCLLPCSPCRCSSIPVTVVSPAALTSLVDYPCSACLILSDSSPSFLLSSFNLDLLITSVCIRVCLSPHIPVSVSHFTLCGSCSCCLSSGWFSGCVSGSFWTCKLCPLCT